MKKLTCALLTIYFLAFSARSALAQMDDDLIKSTQNDIFLVAAAGAGGAVIGLSTLSFVEKPSKHISNIWTGAALGVIAGVIFVAYNSAQKGSEELQASKYFSSFERVAWHSQNIQVFRMPEAEFGTQIFSLSF